MPNNPLAMIRTIALLICAALLLACQDDPPPAATQTTETPAPVAAAPTMAQDQIEHTTEENPEYIDPEKRPDKPQIVMQRVTVGKGDPTTGGVVSGSVAPQPTKSPAPAERSSPPATDLGEAAPAPQPTPAPASAPTETETNTETETEIATDAVPDHGAWDQLLRTYVNDRGNVDYAGLKRNEAKLDAYLTTLENHPPVRQWSRNEALAYWINAYNAYTVKLILDNYPVQKITDLHGGKPWDVQWIDLGDKTYSLNDIEHGIIRTGFDEPRIHFAVNCAAASCPPLPNRAFTPANLNNLLEQRTRAFINNPTYNTLSADGVAVSKIFDWYGEDFGDLRTYLNRYAKTTVAAGTDIGFREYDWTLNAQ